MKPFGGGIGEKIQQKCLLKTEANALTLGNA